ncbi:MAG TPA: hypothetical protein VLK82_00060 [Candidatus Tectomicrobia bacterium]|nr:hypothetical protein [Candidatus Tectomicrobia bacterium]
MLDRVVITRNIRIRMPPEESRNPNHLDSKPDFHSRIYPVGKGQIGSIDPVDNNRVYEGAQKRFGPRRRYGAKINYQAIPEQYQVATYQEEQIQTVIYQAPLWHKSFALPLNVVIVVKLNLQTGARAQAVLFSSDLTLTYTKLIDYYSLRFQLEFNCRDAKQFWGLEDFMHVNQTPVTNAVNLSLFMVNLSSCLIQQMRQEDADASILDLKACFRGRRYAIETLNLLPEPPSSFISDQIVRIVATLGRIHRQSAAPINP